MKTILAVALLAGLIFTGCEPNKPDPTKQTNTVGNNPLNAPTDYLGAMGKAKKMSEKVIDQAAINQAIQLFNVQEERFPKDLQELVTKKYLGALPPPPIGMKFSYNPANGEFKIVKQ